MAQLKDTTVSGNLTAGKIIKSGGAGSQVLMADGSIKSIGTGSSNISAGHTHPYLSSSVKYAGVASGESAGGKAATAGIADKANGVIDYNNTDTVWGIDYNGNSGTTPRDWWCAFDDKNKKIVPVKAPMPYFSDSIILDSIVLDGTTLKNVEFENVGNGIFLSKNILEGISMDNLLAGGSDVGTGTVGRNAAASIEAALKRQFGNSIKLKTYRRTYDGAAHAEKVFIPLESEVHGQGNMSYSADKKDIYPRWQIPNRNVKTGIVGWWWCANRSLSAGYFCLVGDDGGPHRDASFDGSGGVALAFYL